MLQYKIIIFIVLVLFSVVYSEEIRNERYFQKIWCEERQGILEYTLDDKSRVDCLLPEYAVEVEFAKKWAESIGQALYYAIKTNRKPAIVVIIRQGKDEKYLKRLFTVAEKYDIKVFIIDNNEQ